MVRTKEDILDSVTKLAGENVDDNFLSILEDVTDTIDDLTARVTDVDVEKINADWQNKYDALDKEWRGKYRDRFLSGADETVNETIVDESEGYVENTEPLTFEKLFTNEDVEER